MPIPMPIPSFWPLLNPDLAAGIADGLGVIGGVGFNDRLGSAIEEVVAAELDDVELVMVTAVEIVIEEIALVVEAAEVLSVILK